MGRVARWVGGAVAAALLCVPADGRATTGLTWTLAEPVRYQLDADVELPGLMWVYAERNLGARIAGFRVGAVTTCAAVEPLGKRGFEVACTLDSVALHLAPVDHEADLGAAIAEEWGTRLVGATVTLVLLRDGRVRSIDVKGVPFDQVNERTLGIQEIMRQMLARTFASLDLQLPKNGDDKGVGTWRQKESQVMGFPTDLGTLGSAEIEHSIVDIEGPTVDLKTTGRGILGSGEMVSIAGVERPANLFDMTLSGTARFDTERSLLLSRDYTTRGVMTASSIDASGSEGYPYVQVVTLRWLVPGAPVPNLGPHGIVVRTDGPTSTTRPQNAPPP